MKNKEIKNKKQWENVIDLMKSESNNSYFGNEFYSLGRYYSHQILSDIKHLNFTLSRYKFATKLLMYEKDLRVVEYGCQEALGAVMLRQNCDLKEYVGIDLDHDSIEWNKVNMPGEYEFIEADFLEGVGSLADRLFDCAISLDVIEHIEKRYENEYMKAITRNLEKNGTAIIGTPNITMTPYASEGSRIAHINLFDQRRLYDLAKNHFENVFIFGMNDEVVNTGFEPMACYIFAVCSVVK